MTPGQVSLEDAAVEAQKGMDRAAEHAGTEWQAEALQWLRGYLTAHARLLPDDARHCGCPVPPSGEWRALGTTYRKAARLGWMHRSNELAPRASGHCAPAPVWISNLWHGLA